MAPKRKASLAGLDESNGTVQKKQAPSTRPTRPTTRATARAATNEKGHSAKTGDQDQVANPAQADKSKDLGPANGVAGKSTGPPKTRKLKTPSAKAPAKKSSKKADPKNPQNVLPAAVADVQAERSATPSSPSHSPPNTAGESIEVDARKDLRHREIPPRVTPVETINELEKQGFVFPELPENDEEALEGHRQASSRKSQTNDEWIKQAEKDLETRFTNRKGGPSLAKPRHHWYRDFDQTKPKIDPNWHTTSIRKPGAAALNALITAATIPPFGYSGCVRDLIENEQLPRNEVALARASQEARDNIEDRDTNPQEGNSPPT